MNDSSDKNNFKRYTERQGTLDIWTGMCSVADPECLSRIRIFPSRIPDPHQRVWVFWVFWSKKLSLSSQKYDLGCSSRIRTPVILPIPDPGGKKGTGSRIRIRNTDFVAAFKKNADFPGHLGRPGGRRCDAIRHTPARLQAGADCGDGLVHWRIRRNLARHELSRHQGIGTLMLYCLQFQEVFPLLCCLLPLLSYSLLHITV